MIHEAVYSRLKNNAGVSALVGARVYPIKGEQAVTLPYTVYSRISVYGREISHGNTTKAAKSRFQIDCYAKTPTQAAQISEAVVTAFHGWKGTVGSEKIFISQVVDTQDAFDLDTNEYVVPVDVEIFHKEG